MKDDILLIKRLNASDKAAFGLLYDKYVGMVFRFILSVLKDETLSKDLTQFCFMQLWEHRKDIATDRNLPAWLYVTARNAVYKETRRRLTANRYSDYAKTNGMFIEEERTPDMDITLVEKEIMQVIDNLPEARRKIFIMKAFQKMSVKQIADALGISAKTVETQMARAKKTLKEKVSELLLLAFIISSGL
ncbi:MAG: RNA polymerase sigma factor [Candidatus Cryptobacteroides sp.]